MSAGSYTHFPSPMKTYVFSGLIILMSAVPGATLSWLLISPLGLPQVPFAIAVVMLGMVLSVAIFAGWAALGRALKISRA